MNQHKHWKRTGIYGFIILLMLATLTLSSCGGSGGGGGSSTVTPLGVSHRGYYEGTATISCPTNCSGTGGELLLNSPGDMQSMVNLNEFVLVNVANLIGYKVSFTKVTDTSFTANVRVYQNGVFLDTATISDGAIITDAATGDKSLTGTIAGVAGADYVNATFDILYDSVVNARAARVYDIFTPNVDENAWGDRNGYMYFSATDQVFLRPVGNGKPSQWKDCEADSISLESVETESPGRLLHIPNTTAFVKCVNGPYLGSTASVYFTNFDASVEDDTMLFVMFNNDILAMFAKPCGAADGNCFVP